MEKELDSKLLASVIARALDEKLGKDITILNISNVSSLADYFVIVTGDSTPQVKALMNNTKERIKELFSRSPVRFENDGNPLKDSKSVSFRDNLVKPGKEGKSESVLIGFLSRMSFLVPGGISIDERFVKPQEE